MYDGPTDSWVTLLPFLSLPNPSPSSFVFLNKSQLPTHKKLRKSLVNERQHKNPQTKRNIEREREREMPINSSFLFHSFLVKRNRVPFHCFISNLKRSMSRSSSAGQSSSFSRPRHVVKRLLAKPQHEGEGAVVRRSIGRLELKDLDPFLLMDEFSVSAPAGFPDHPHRGFETVTYMLDGVFTHQDFAGHKGTIRTGDLQWMTAGRGIIHSEMPEGEGIQRGLQLWINLTAKDKMIAPGYQELQSEDINRVEKDGVEVCVIAGEAMGVRSPVYTRTPTMFLDFTLRPGAHTHQHIPDSWNSFVYVLEGEGIFGNSSSSPATAHHTLVLSTGDGLSIWNRSTKLLRFVLIGGQPLNEPVVQYGPFVMNTQAEIDQTIEDFQFCKNGFENATSWKSQP